MLLVRPAVIVVSVGPERKTLECDNGFAPTVVLFLTGIPMLQSTFLKKDYGK